MTPSQPSDRPPPRPPGPPPLPPAPPVSPAGRSPPPLTPAPAAPSHGPAPVVVVASADRKPAARGTAAATFLFAGLGAAVVAGVVLFLIARRPDSPADLRNSAEPVPADVGPPAFAGRSAEPHPEGAAATPAGETASPQALFEAVQERLAASGYQPIASLDPTSPRAQEAELVEVGDLPISVAFPSEPLGTTPEANILCLPDGPGRWRLEMRTSLGTSRVAGELLVRDGVLVATLPARTPDNDLARAAVAAGLVRVALQGQPALYAHVQLRRTVELLPLVFRGLGFDPAVAAAVGELPAADAAGGAVLAVDLPPSPWPCWPDLQGRCGNATGLVSLMERGTPLVAGDPAPTTWTVDWVSPAAPDGPFLESEFALEPGQPPLRKTVVRLVTARVPADWRTYRRFGRFDPEDDRAEGLVPTVARLRAELAGLPPAEGTVSAEAMAAYAKLLIRLRRPANADALTAPLVFAAPEFANRRLPLDRWAAALRLEYDRGDATARAPLTMLLEELEALPAGKRLAAEVVAGLGSGAAEFTGRLETRFPSLGAAVVIATVGPKPAAPADTPPRP